MDVEFTALVFDDDDIEDVARELAAVVGGAVVRNDADHFGVGAGGRIFYVRELELDDDGGVPFSRSRRIIELPDREGFEQLKALRRPMMLVRHLCEPVEEFAPPPLEQPCR